MTTAAIRSEKKRMGKGDVNGADDVLLPGATVNALDDHVFKSLPLPQKLDRLLSLYSGLVSKLETTRKDFANREGDIHSKVGELAAKIDRVLDLEQLLMNHFGIRVPTEPPAPPPARRKGDKGD
ncbi:MAG TPA: hypothetical protein VK509_24645 [Polyangiales bacterium]|jgi:hypothetical protein|nr:hypothetical protein [Polyangiales bacterium]